MDIDKHEHTIEQLQRDVNGTMADLLPGYIRRHRSDIVLAIREEAKYVFDNEEQTIAIWGATKALDALAGGCIECSPETPSVDATGAE